jgi:hypothetical protein
MGKSTISMAMFNSYVAVYQRVAPFPGGKRIFLALFRVAEHSQREKSWQVVQVTVGDGKANAP